MDVSGAVLACDLGSAAACGALASGAGAGAQKAIGTAVVGGVVTSTFLVTLFAPLFYVFIEQTLGKGRKPRPAKSVGPTPPANP